MLTVRVTSSIVDYRAQVVMVMEVGVHLFSAVSSPAAPNRPLVSLLLLLLMVLLLMLLLLLFL